MPVSGWRSRSSIAARTPSSRERGRQPDVDDREVGLVRVDDPEQPRAVLGDGDDLDPALAHERDEALAQQRVVLGDHDPHGSSTRITVPAPGPPITASVPSSASARWRRPVRPGAAAGRRRRARRRRPRRAGGRRAGAASRAPRRSGACLATLVSDSATTKYAAVSTTGQRAIGQLGGHRDGRSRRAARATRPRRRARGRPARAARCRGRGRAARRSPRPPRRARGGQGRRPRAGRRAAPRRGRAAC